MQEEHATNLSFRIRNETLATNDTDRLTKAIDVCDIVLTPIVPDVKIVKDEMDYAPGFPSVQDPISFHIDVENLYESAPAEHITPWLVWRQSEEDDWRTNIMVHAENDGGRTNQNPGTFHLTLTPDDGVTDGPFEYFYMVSFTGYTPTFPALKYPENRLLNNVRNFEYDWNEIFNNGYKYLIHTNSWALLTDATGTNSECRAPVYYPDFAAREGNSSVPGANYYDDYTYNNDVVPGSTADVSPWSYTRAFDLWDLNEGWPAARAHFAQRDGATNTVYVCRTLEIPAKFPYLSFLAKDGVRRFRSFYTDVAAVTHPWTNTIPAGVEPAYPMQHVGDYTWQAIIHITNLVEAAFSVTGACYAAEGATSYETGPFEWLEIGQDPTNINPPMSGSMSVDDAGGTLVTNHHELIRFPMERRVDDVLVTVTNTPVIQVPVETTGTFLGIVTNDLFYTGAWTNSNGEAIPPTADDAAYWCYRLVSETIEDHDLETGEVTNTVVVVHTNAVMQNWVPDGEGGWTLLDFGTFNDGQKVTHYITAPNRILVQDERTVATGMTLTNGEETVEFRWTKVTNSVPVIDAAWTNNGETIRSHVQIDYDGFLMYRFCTTNGAYQIRRAAWQDFNTWQADDRYYWRSAGLYDMKSFASTLDGREITEFEPSLSTGFLDGLAASSVADYASEGKATIKSRWCRSSGEYWDGLYGRDAQFFVERLPADPTNKTDRTLNGAILLNAHPDQEGAVETTRVMTGAGRDTLKMRVRSFTDDGRAITYRTDASMPSLTDYIVLARIREPESSSDRVSDGEHSLSLVGYRQSSRDYWEARITQKTRLGDAGSGGVPQQQNWFEIHVYQIVDNKEYEVNGGWVYCNGTEKASGWKFPVGSTRPATFPAISGERSDQTNNQFGNAYVGEDGLFTRTSKKGWAFAFDLRTLANGNVKPAVYAFHQEAVGSFATNNFSYRFDCPETTPKRAGEDRTPLSYGRPGINLRDCGLRIAPYVYSMKPADAASELAKLKGGFQASGVPQWGSVPISSDEDWYHNELGGYDSEQAIDVWQVNKPAGVAASSNPTTLTRKDPRVWYRVEVFRSGRETATNALTALAAGDVHADWNRSWDVYHESTTGRQDGWQSASSWRWETVEIPMNFWDDTFINIQAYAENGDLTEGDPDKPSLAMLAVDSIYCRDWRGQTIADPKRSDEDVGWRATYAAIAAEGREGRRYELNRSRTNPNQTASATRQGITTPLLENGVGDITFTYTVENHPVNVAVGVLDSYGRWTVYSTNTLPVTEKPAPYYVYIATNLTGRIRIVTDDPSRACRTNGQLGTLYVDNLKATDYPATGSTSWEVYNALVSTFPSNMAQRATLSPLDLRKAKFDGVSEAVRSYRSAILNDRESQHTVNNTPLDEHTPYLQTPSIETGIGEVSFWYRASDDNGDDLTGNPGKIRLMASESPNAPDEMWEELTVTNLYSDVSENPEYPRQLAEMQGLTNITTKTWTYFNVEFFEQKYRVLRIQVDDDAVEQGKPNRIMLDNVLITEPVRSSIDVGAFHFIPDIPVNTKDTHAQVKLENPRMNPTEIKVWLEWYAAPGIISNVPIKTVTYKVHEDNQLGPFYEPVTLPDGRVVQAEYYIPDPWVETIETINETRYPALLNDREEVRPWGYETWSNRWTDAVTSGGRTFAGSIVMTNVPNSYVYITSEPIPTEGMEPDSVLQYCVKVDYKGRFHSPVYSELQGEAKNGYRFENPPWYDPIDLNVPMGTTNKPVSYAFVFSCTTNVVYINEFKPATPNNGPDSFIEIMGPAGASVANWRVEHFGNLNNVLSPKRIVYTNIVQAGATFQPAWNPADPTTVNKGWGFWVMGNYRAQETLPEIARAYNPDARLEVQELFPSNIAARTSSYFTVPGAMRLRRSMGAYVDKIAWGQQGRLTAFLDESEGFQWAGNLTQGTRSIAKDDLESDGPEGHWSTTQDFTPGGYNADEEDALPDLGGIVPEPPRVPAGIDPPVIHEFEFVADDLVRIRFAVRIAADSLAEGLTVEEEDYTWKILVTSDVEDMGFGPGDNPLATTDAYDPMDANGDVFVPVPTEDGEWTYFDVYAPANGTPSWYYRIYACPNQ